MAGGSIRSTVAKLEADTQRIRSEGLQELKHLLQETRFTTNDDGRRDDGFHKIFELLYHVVSKEKPVFLRATKPTSKKNAASRLETAATALRLAVEASAPIIRFKTTLSILDHIVDTLPNADGHFCEPLISDYLKSFRTLLEYGSNGEHLRHKQWQHYVDFALAFLSDGLDNDTVIESRSNLRESGTASQNSHPLPVRPSQVNSSHSGTEASLHADEVISALQHLTSVANAPVMSRANEVVDVVLEFLLHARRARESAFHVLNNVVAVAMGEDLTLSQHVLSTSIPIIRRLWPPGSIALRDQILLLLYRCRYLFVIFSDPWPQTPSRDLRLLLTTLLSDYRSRNERDILHIEDVHPATRTSRSLPRTKHFEPVRTSSRAVSCWSGVSIIACLVSALSQQHLDVLEEPQDDGPRKRQKLQSTLDEVIQDAVGGVGQAKTVALQVLLFMFDQPIPVPLVVAQSVPNLLPDLYHEDGEVQSWTQLLFARLAENKTFKSVAASDVWAQVWSAARRALSAPSSVRAACHTLDVLLRTRTKPPLDGQGIQDALFGGGSNGPSALTDTSLLLLTTALRSTIFSSDRDFERLCSKIMAWLASHWTMSSNLDRAQNAIIASHARPQYLYDLLVAICGVSDIPPSFEEGLPAYSLWEALVRADGETDFLVYLIGLKTTDQQESEPPASTSYRLDPQNALRLARSVMNFLDSRLKELLHAWIVILAERASNIGIDIVEILATASFVSTAFWLRCGQRSHDSNPPLNWSQTRTALVDFVMGQSEDEYSTMATRICSCFLTLHSALSVTEIDLSGDYFNSVVVSTLRLAKQALVSQTQNQLSDADFFDPVSLNSQTTQNSHKFTGADFRRLDTPSSQSPNDLLARQTMELTIVAEFVKSNGAFGPPAAAAIVDEALALGPSSLLAAREPLEKFLGIRTGLTRVDADRLLTKLANAFLQDEAFERCEAALCFCLRVLHSLAHLWTSEEENDSLASTAFDIYDWFINTALDKGIASQETLVCMSNLLGFLLHTNPAYGEGDVASPRTSLLKILQCATFAVKFRLAENLSGIFDKYVLTEHTAIFDDIVDILPTDPDSKEGIAVRLSVVSQLGARWHTVLRQAVYHLFETVANVKSMTAIARACILDLCSALKTRHPRDLFKAFSPQIFYTWLSRDNLAQLPFHAFDYSSVEEMVLDNVAELTGQIALRGSTQTEQICQLTGRPWESLLEEHFAYAEAYTLASETSLPKETRLYDGSEKAVRKVLGSELHLQLLHERLPETIARLIIGLQDDRGFDKALEKSAQPSTLAAWQEMRDYCDASVQLPMAQQPSFRAKCLPDQLNYLFQRIKIQPRDVWSPALLIYVYRQLLEKCDPSLGPFHVCSVIRKFRIVISLAGSVALQGYQLEMILHNLRRYLTIFDCAEDTMGIFRYLLSHSTMYLVSRPSFVAGLGVAIFAALPDFIASSQDSTTQESHFRSTMTKAQEFRRFLGENMSSLTVADLNDSAASTFTQLLHHARAITGPGNSAKSTSEGKLLFSLMADQSDDVPLLAPLQFDIVAEILCRDFRTASDIQDDILKDDRDALRFTSVLASMLATLSLSRSFRIWAAQGVGRGYIMRGLRLETPQSSAQTHSAAFLGDQDVTAISSYTRILEYLSALLWKSDVTASTFSERTLQLIFSAMPRETQDALVAPTFDRQFIDELRFKDFPCPSLSVPSPISIESSFEALAGPSNVEEHASWASRLLVDLCGQAVGDHVLGFLVPLVHVYPQSSETILPFAVHLLLLSELDSGQPIRAQVSQAFTTILHADEPSSKGTSQLILRTILYLQHCCMPGESNVSQRCLWLDIDLGQAAVVASKCLMWHEALFLLDLQISQSHLQSGRASRRSLATSNTVPDHVMSAIYENVDDPDFFYGKHETFDLQSVLNKMGHERAIQKSLSFHSAILDSRLRVNDQDGDLSTVAQATARTLNSANMRGISSAVQQHYQFLESDDANAGLQRSIGEWNLGTERESSTSYASLDQWFRMVQTSSTRDHLTRTVDIALLQAVQELKDGFHGSKVAGRLLSQLAVFSETKQIATAETFDNLDSVWADLLTRTEDIRHAEFERLSPVLSGREATFAAIRQNSTLRESFSLSLQQALSYEIRMARLSLSIAASYEASQFSLNRAMYLDQLNELARGAGVKVDVAVQYDLARILWAHNEVSASIGLLQNLRNRIDIEDQSVIVTRADILTDLGHKIAEARLEKPDEIVKAYLLPAFKELHGRTSGVEAGRVFHNFAAFCDMQLQDSDNLDDFTRIGQITERKSREVSDLENMYKKAPAGAERDRLKVYLSKALNWFKLDEQEWKRVQKNRQSLILQCLENYLLSMRASDNYPNDTLRFLALWLNQAESPEANQVVRKHLSTVPTLKFAPLVQQLSSRLLNTKDDFQQLLMDLMFQICSDHPYHSLYQVYAISKSKGAKADDIAVSRHAAATRLAELVHRKSVSAAIWVSVHNASHALMRVATERLADKDLKVGSKIQLRKLPSGQKLEHVMTESHTKIPPPTMKIDLRASRDYSGVPAFDRFDPWISIAGGVSAPKITTMIASDGSRHKMLLKGGNDDLRQDAIMEQVFEQVSNLLKDHRETRERQLGIRSYKVIPLHTNAGIIEFVQNTIPLHDFLLPAHTRYFPKDYKPSRCRKDIADAQTKSLEQRVRAYHTVITNFHPVMRFFFIENFPDPDDWFYKRLDYSRSTAAVSILGHVLGIGDRHGHNILLDQQSGEVVHIDLGVAFEAGRVLPVPEVVPFRLTRDLVDGMGSTGVEGVFRRCCNFTLEALRRDQEAIMTILDVLRYDPLHSWSVSPLRLKKMQENSEQVAVAGAGVEAPSAPSHMIAAEMMPGVMAGKRDVSEPSEADRALTVVAKKLGKALSVEATVNELIRQATDDRNLAVLYCGWAAYA